LLFSLTINKPMIRLLLCFWLSPLWLLAQDKSVPVKYIETPIEIDGKLDEAPWSQTQPATEFWQYFPSDSVQARNQAEIRFLFDDRTLYVGMKINAIGNDYVVPSLKRDFRAGGSDNITLLFDTFNDGTNAFMFGTNPEGVRREALVSGGGTELRGFTTSWDTKWVGEVVQYDGYYIAEWAIPLSAFKYKEGETRWRFNSYHFDTQDNERNTWINIPRNQFIFNLAYMGDMVFERPLGNSKSPISIIPYVNGLAGMDREADDDFTEFKVGGDAKVTIGNSMNLDLTINPDFSQVEVDQQVTNLTRFEVNLPERRQFFIENSDLFADFGNSRDANPFFSRRIGIAKDTADNTIQNDIIGGLRLSGKVTNDLRLGVLNMQTTNDEKNEIASNNNTVVALQQKVFSRSNVSMVFINRQNTSDKDYVLPEEEYNRVVGLDYNLANVDNTWTGKFYLHKSFTPELESNDWSTGARLVYNTTNWRIRASGLFVGENFTSDLGFIRRTDIVKIDPEIEYLLFPKKSRINQHTFGFLPIMTWRPEQDFQLSDYNIIFKWDAEFKNTSRLNARSFNRYVYLYDEFDPSLSDGVPLPPDTDYRFSSFELSYRSDNRKSFFFNLRPSYGQFFNGEKLTLQGDVNWRFQPYVNIALQARYDKVDLPEPYSDNDIWLISPRFEITFSKSVFWTTLVQYSSLQENIGINSRLQWRFAPLSDLYLVYNDNYYTDDVFAPRFRSINLKVTYWLYI